MGDVRLSTVNDEAHFAVSGFGNKGKCHVRSKAAERGRDRDRFASRQFRRFKADSWEGGHRAPFHMRWPARGPPACLTDLLATAPAVEVGRGLFLPFYQLTITSASDQSCPCVTLFQRFSCCCFPALVR